MFFDVLGVSGERLGSVLAASWGVRSSSRGRLGDVLGCLGVSWARFGGVFKASGFVSADL